MSPVAENRRIASQLSQGLLENKQEQLRVALVCQVVDKALRWQTVFSNADHSSHFLINQAVKCMSMGFPHLPIEMRGYNLYPLWELLRRQFLFIAHKPTLNKVYTLDPNVDLYRVEFPKIISYKCKYEHGVLPTYCKEPLVFNFRCPKKTHPSWRIISRDIEVFARERFRKMTFETKEDQICVLSPPKNMIISPRHIFDASA
ncbi:MAG: hypothetical protein AAGJ93_18150 [Bacteroidota bacterium]